MLSAAEEEFPECKEIGPLLRQAAGRIRSMASTIESQEEIIAKQRAEIEMLTEKLRSVKKELMTFLGELGGSGDTGLDETELRAFEMLQGVMLDLLDAADEEKALVREYVKSTHNLDSSKEGHLPTEGDRVVYMHIDGKYEVAQVVRVDHEDLPSDSGEAETILLDVPSRRRLGDEESLGHLSTGPERLDLSPAAQEAAKYMDLGYSWASAAAATATRPASAAGPAPPAPPADAAPPPPAPRGAAPSKPSKRERAGAEAKKRLSEVARLRGLGKMVVAAQKLRDIPEGHTVLGDAVDKASRAMKAQLIKLGGLKTIRNILDKFLRRTLIKLVSPESQMDLDEKNAKDTIIDAARDFFGGIMASKGRRSDVDRNAFWAVASALLPKSLLEDRKGRAAMRLLGVNYRVVKKAGETRAKLEDQGSGWKLMTTAEHSDKRNYEALSKWAHSADASTEDNDNKTPVRVVVEVKGGENYYVIHYRRYLNGTYARLLRAFRESPEFAEMARLHLETEKAKRRAKAAKIVRARGEDDRTVEDQIDAEIAKLTVESKERWAMSQTKRALGGKEVIKLRFNQEHNRDPSDAEVMS